MSFAGQILRSLNRWVGWFLVISILIIALLTVVIRQLMPGVNEYRAEIEAYLSERLRTEVTLGDIQASWDGRFPTLLIQDLKIADHRSRNIGQITLGQMVLGINPVASLLKWQPVMSRVDIWSLHSNIDFKRWPKGGQDKTASGSVAEDPLAALWMQPRIFFHDTQLNINLLSGEQVVLQSDSIHLENSGQQHHFAGELKVLHDEREAAATLIVESDSGDFDPETNAIDFYLKISGLDDQLLSLAREIYPMPHWLDQLAVNTELWGNWSEGRLTRVFGSLESDRLQLNRSQSELAGALLIQDLSTDFALLQPEPGRFQLQIEDLSMLLSGQQLLVPRLAVNRSSGLIRSLAIEQIDLLKLREFSVNQTLLPEGIVTALKQVNPRGELNNLLLTWPHKEGADWETVELAADLQQVGFDAAYGAPAMAGIDGLLQMQYSGGDLSGRVDLLSKNFDFHIPEVFDQGWAFTAASGVTHFSLADNILHLQSEYSQLAKSGINADGRWSLYLPLTREIQSELTLLIGMKNSDGSLAPELIPDHEIDPGIKKWVSGAIKQGQVRQGAFMLHTGTRSIPSRQPPTVQLFLDVTDATVDYQPGWPAVTKASAQFLLRDQGVAINVSEGQIRNSKVQHGWVYLPPGAQRLHIVSRLTGDGDDVIQTLLESPVISGDNNELKGWALSGQTDTRLNLQIPLQGGGPRVDVSSRFSALSMSSESRDLSFTELSGQLNYLTGKGLYTESLTGTLFDQPLQARVATLGEGRGEKIRISLDSKVDLKRIQKWSGIGFLALAEGVQPYQADLDICTRDSCSGLTLRSDLAQTKLDLIAPFAKEKGTAMPLLLHNDFQSQESQIALGDKFRARIKMQKDQLHSAALNLDGSNPKIVGQPGVYITGMLPALQYESLIAMLEKGGWLSNQEATGVKDPLPVQADLKIGLLDYADVSLAELEAHVESLDGSWIVALKNDELDLQVNIYDQAETPAKIEFKYLYLDPLLVSLEGDGDVESTSLKSAIKPGDLPEFDLSINKFIYNDHNWGQVSFNLRNRDQTSVVENLRLEMPGVSAGGSLVWGAGDESDSTLKLTVDAGDLGVGLQNAGFEKVIETDKFSAQLALKWPGAPWQYSLANADGEATFIARDGRLLEAGAGTGFLRVFGILNLNTLGRRLKLDFKDLFAKGVTFDKMQGDYIITRGIAMTREPFVMSGPSLNMVMRGELDLENETVDKQMAVTLPVTDNIPLAAFLLGAPQVAGIAFVLDKLVGDEVKKQLATVTYTMKGDWSKPQVNLLQNNAQKPKKPQDQEQTSP